MKILTHNRNAERKLELVSKWKISKEDRIKVKEFCDKYKSGLITGRVPNNPDALIDRTLDWLKPSLEYLNKKEIKKETLENFVKKILKGDIANKNNNKSYAPKSQMAIFKVCSQYLLFRDGEKIKSFLTPLNVKIKLKPNDFKILKKEEIDKLYNSEKDIEKKFIIANLFSSGCRAEEFVNLRLSDLTLPTGKENFVKVRVRDEYSKTEGRTIQLYYPKSLEATKKLLALRLNENAKPEDTILKLKYNGIKDYLKNIGIKVLDKHTHFHLFRHSSATWLASKLNRQQLCIFFGWKFSSPMPDKYIRRDGVDGYEEVANKFEKTEIEEHKIKSEKEIKLLKKKQEEMEVPIKLHKKLIEGLDESGWEIIISPNCDPKKKKKLQELTNQLLKN